ncbi:hypothetical protein [Sphingomonas sp. 8AM]|uniref:hypothetical protein n=1 Tax=Sphingomonas sp. 8AM TaxID=2653170 RepID=UPI0012F3477C|nr:hypothetical protein [Sphingomonas sp. 8AM]VXC42829.1 conserved hypothetical protein [Sphingomonas sp. 8AM]
MGRQARQLTKGFTACLTGKQERGTDRKVRRHSIDVDDRRARVSRPIGDGTTAGALSWIDCLLKAVSEWDDEERARGGARPLGLHGLRVLEAILGRRGKVAIDFRSGRLDPQLVTIARAAKVTKTTVVRALARLKAMKVLDWIRRTERTGNDGSFGPLRRQVSNSYFFTPEALPARVAQRLRDLLARRRLRRSGTMPPGSRKAFAQPSSPELRDLLDRMEAGIARASEGVNASPPYGQYPLSGVEG